MIINSIKTIWKPPWELDISITEISLLIAEFPQVQINHIYREISGSAIKLVNLGHDDHAADSSPQDIFVDSLCIPASIDAIIRKDAIGWPTNRR